MSILIYISLNLANTNLALEIKKPDLIFSFTNNLNIIKKSGFIIFLNLADFT